LAPPDPHALHALAEVVSECRACPRLVAWREAVALDKRASFRDESYWGRPVPGFGDPSASLMIVGLAPAAHGGNRTGRVFTGDRSGDFLYASLYRTGWSNQPTSTSRDDGLRLTGAYITAAVRCAPPANKPTPDERDRCLPYLGREIELLTAARVMVVLGSFGYEAAWRALRVAGTAVPSPRPRFGHGVEVPVGGEARPMTVLCSFHPSQQNTFTGKLTEPMIDSIFHRARELAFPS
jgi:uracil-DNA glycosylase family 4